METKMLQQTVGGTATLPRKSSFRYRKSQQRSGVLFITPFVVLFVCGLIVPLGYAVWLSLFQDQMVGGQVFIGLGNYIRAATDPVLIAGLGRVLLFLAIQIPVGLCIALLAAVAIDSGRLRFAGLFRIGIFIPFAVPTVVAALMWGYIYGPQFGLVGDVARVLHIPAPNLLSAFGIMPALANIVVWQSTGYYMLIFYATLKSIPQELYEAAELDGAGEFRKLVNIKIPALRSTIGLTLFFGVIGAIQLFTEPNVLQPLDPVVITSGFTPNVYAYNLAFSGNSFDYSAAISVGLGILTIAAAAIGQFVIARNNRRNLEVTP
jgi:multiple sugar transport system permease protein